MMAHLREDEVYIPNLAHKDVYDQLYAEYKVLHNYIGRGENDVMKRLKALKSQVLGSK